MNDLEGLLTDVGELSDKYVSIALGWPLHCEWRWITVKSIEVNGKSVSTAFPTTWPGDQGHIFGVGYFGPSSSLDISWRIHTGGIVRTGNAVLVYVINNKLSSRVLISRFQMDEYSDYEGNANVILPSW